MSIKSLSILATGLFLTACSADNISTAEQPIQAGNQPIKIVSWNMEHLAENVGAGCKPRTEQDYLALQKYAETLNADVVAVQEVESAKALAKVFPESQWRYQVSERPSTKGYECRGMDGQISTPQRTAIVVKKGINYTANPSFTEVAVSNPGLRYGVSITLTDHPEKLEVLNLHLKSGCFVDDYSASDRRACQSFKKQAPILESWINSKIENNQAFVVLGDFNHRLSTQNNRFWNELQNEDGKEVVTNTMGDLKSCHPKYKDLIDHIITGPRGKELVVSGSQQVDHFGKDAGKMGYKDMLSDHCPIAITVK